MFSTSLTEHKVTAQVNILEEELLVNNEPTYETLQILILEY